MLVKKGFTTRILWAYKWHFFTNFCIKLSWRTCYAMEKGSKYPWKNFIISKTKMSYATILKKHTWTLRMMTLSSQKLTPNAKYLILRLCHCTSVYESSCMRNGPLLMRMLRPEELWRWDVGFHIAKSMLHMIWILVQPYDKLCHKYIETKKLHINLSTISRGGCWYWRIFSVWLCASCVAHQKADSDQDLMVGYAARVDPNWWNLNILWCHLTIN